MLATATGVFLSTRAAHGIPPRKPRRLSTEDLVLDDRLAARRGARDLRAAMIAAAVSLLLLLTAIGLVWFGSG